jgi:flavin-dependent dehydrogenase
MDAIVAGGGLAGAAFALELARRGAKAMLIERMPGPHHKVCGDFLSANAIALLHHLGLDLAALGGSRIATLSLANRGTEARAPLPFEAMGLSRYRLDEALLAAAAANGVTVLRGTIVDGIDTGPDGVVVRTSCASYRGRAAALASGKHNIRGIPRPASAIVGFKMHVIPAPEARRAMDGVVQLAAFQGGYVGLCLVEDGVLSVAWNIRSDVLQEIGPSWRAQKAFLARESAIFDSLVGTATPMWEKPLAIAGLPYGFLRVDPVAPAVYPVGDQLAVIPSFAGDGTALALASGISAAQALLKGEDACAFQRRMVATHRRQFRLVGALDRVIANAALRCLGIGIAKRVPSLVTRLAAATRLGGTADIVSPASRPV